MENPDAERTSQLLQTIEILEKLESLMDLAPSPEIEDIMNLFSQDKPQIAISTVLDSKP